MEDTYAPLSSPTITYLAAQGSRGHEWPVDRWKGGECSARTKWLGRRTAAVLTVVSTSTDVDDNKQSPQIVSQSRLPRSLGTGILFQKGDGYAQEKVRMGLQYSLTALSVANFCCSLAWSAPTAAKLAQTVRTRLKQNILVRLSSRCIGQSCKYTAHWPAAIARPPERHRQTHRCCRRSPHPPSFL